MRRVEVFEMTVPPALAAIAGEKLPEPTTWDVWAFHSWGPWLSVRILHAVIFFLCAFLLDRGWRIILRRAQQAAQDEDPTGEMALERRVETHAALFRQLGAVFFYVTALLMTIKDFGVEIGPLLAGLGIVGVAVGFGAQFLVRDIISGFFVILENQIHIGDVVKVGDCQGVVEEIQLRTVRLRAAKGEVHIVPNGEIRVLTNYSRHWARAVLDVGVAYASDLDRVFDALAEVGRRTTGEATFDGAFLEKPEILGVTDLGDSKVTVRLWVKVLPDRVWEVERGLRKVAKAVFDERGIAMPFPQRTLSFDQEAARLLAGRDGEKA